MKRFLIGFVTSPLLAQDTVPITPHHDLTQKDIIDLLAEYEVRHVDPQPFSKSIYRATDYESRVIWIVNFETCGVARRQLFTNCCTCTSAIETVNNPKNSFAGSGFT